MSQITKEQAIEAAQLLAEFLAQEDAGGGEAAAPAVEIPTPDEVDGLEKDAVKELAASLSIDVEGKKFPAIKQLVKTLAKVKHEVELDADEDDVNELATALALTPDKKEAKTLAAIKEWVDALGAGGEASTEETPEATTEETTTEETPPEETTEETPASADGDEPEATTEEPPAAEENPNADNVDREEVAKGFKTFPDVKTMTSRLDAYNKAANEEIAYDKKNPKDGYRSLVAQLVASDETIAEWGKAYIRDGSGYCCGLELDEVTKPKGVTRLTGKCKVTGKLFVLNKDQNAFDEHKAK